METTESWWSFGLKECRPHRFIAKMQSQEFQYESQSMNDKNKASRRRYK